MYNISARQILSIALLSAFVAAGAVACFDRFGSQLQPKTVAFTENTPIAGITDPTVASDERNNIEVYRTMSPGVVFITSTSRGKSS